MMSIRMGLRPHDLATKLEHMWNLSGDKILAIEGSRDPAEGAPVFTVEGRYTARGWTEWTQGFQFGSAILQYDATGDAGFLELGRSHTVADMAGHVTHSGVHDHGFNNISTYGNLWRLVGEGRISADGRENDFYELALKASGAVQARRWTTINDGRGFIYSFNGPHSLFADTVRSLRSLAVAHRLGHALLGENDTRISLLERLVQHAHVTAEFTVYYGDGRDRYDISGRVAQESIFNINDGRYRCPSTQQGYSPFTTWTRGLSWIMLGCAEQLEFIAALSDPELEPLGGRDAVEGPILKAARATCDFYVAQSPADGIPYWDTGAPNLHRLGDYLEQPADPFNLHEPVDSSAAAVAAQALLRLGHHLRSRPDMAGESGRADGYWLAGLTVLDRLLGEPYLSTDPGHQGLLLHSIYHHPQGWDHVSGGSAVAHGESSMWGDYHLREAALYLQRILGDGTYHRFFGS